MMTRSIIQIVNSIRRSKLLGTALYGLALLHLVMQFAVVLPREVKRIDRDRDVPVYWLTAKNVQENKPLYVKRQGFGPDQRAINMFDGRPVYLYPPPFAAVIAPLGSLSFASFSAIWFVLNFIAFWIFAWALAKLSGEASLRRVLICALIAGVWPGMYYGMWLGQINAMLCALFAMGLTSHKRRWLWGLAALAKLFYIWPLIAQFTDTVRRDGAKVLFRRAVPLVTIVGALIIYGGTRCGWESYVIWARDVLPSLSQGAWQNDNLSISFAMLRLARIIGWHYSGGPLSFLPHLWLTLSAIITPLLTWWLLRKQSTELKCACIVPVSIFFGPVCWSYYLPVLLPAFTLLFRDKIAETKTMEYSSSDLIS